MRNYFWIAIGPLLAATSAGLILLARKRMNYTQPSSSTDVYFFYVLSGLMVAIIWAIFISEQIKNRRIKLWSIFLLVTLEAVWFSAFRIFNSEQSLFSQ